MDKFSKILKDAVEGYEAPFDPQAWESMSSQLGNELDPFESSMKDAVDKFPAPAADPMIWSAISSQLGNTLSPFEEAMKDSVDQFQPPAADPLIWENIASELGNSPFEESIKESVEGYEAPYSASTWEAIVEQLGTSNTWKWLAGSAAILTLLLGGYYFLPTDKEESNHSDTKEIVAKDLNGDKQTNTVKTNSDRNESTDLTADTDENLISENDQSDPSNQNNPLHFIDPSDENAVSPMEENGPLFVPSTPKEDQGENGSAPESAEGKEDNTAESGDDLPPDTTPPTEEIVTNYIASIRCDSESCRGTEMTFIADKPEQGCDYVWQFGDGTKAFGPKVIHTFNEEGEFDVKLTIVKGRDVLATDEQLIVVHEIPTADFAINHPNEAIPSYTFINQTEAGTNVVWEVDGMGETNRSEFEMTFREKGTYVAQLTATNNFGCSSSAKEVIEIDNDYNLFAPMAINLSAIDDRVRTFMPPALQILDQEFVMTIYSEKGGMVYQTRDANQPWQGTNADGSLVEPSTAYVWIVQLKNAHGEMETYKGTITVIRS